MSIDTSISGSSCQTLVVLVWDVLSSLRVSVSLGQAKVDHMNDVLLFAMANQEVVWFHVTVNEVVIVKEFKSLYHLVSNHQSSLDCEFTFAEVESVLETRPQQVHDHRIVVSFHSKPVDRRDAS